MIIMLRFVNKICSLILFSFIFYLNGFGQTKKITTDKGQWQFIQYGKNILKVTFFPNGLFKNENISDAVVMNSSKVITIPIVFKKDTVFIGLEKKLCIVNAFQKAEARGFVFKLAADEKIFGGGERALPLNRRGYRFNLYNNPWYAYVQGADNLNYSVPFFTSSKGYGLFFDNPSKGYVDIGKSDSSVFEAGFVSGELNVYLILGNDYKEILTTYHQLTGTQPLPPRWAFGNFMSRFGYTSLQQVEKIAGKMEKENIPFDAIIFDLFWFGDSIKGTLGNLDWINKKKWPHPKSMIETFKRKHINTVLITEPFLVETSKNYTNSLKYHAVDSIGKPYLLTDFYFGRGGLIDIFRKDAQRWFWKKHVLQMKKGVEAWWGDLGEPERHPSNLYHNLKDMGYNRLFSADEVHNIYGHVWTKFLFKNYATHYPQKRLFSLNRSGFAGSQRYAIFPWSGDVSRSWGGLAAQLPVMLGMSMSGVPYIHADAGGFAGGDGDNELYVRWLQFAAFTPIFRPHGTALYDIDSTAFSFPSEPALIANPYREIVKKAVLQRYQLLPYNYTMAYQQTKNGKPLVAPLYYYYPKDTAVTHVSDEFMWGENLLVAPVLEKGKKEQKIYLPEGSWYSFNASLFGQVAERIQKSTVATIDINSIPVFVKAGSFIPMCTQATGNTTHDFTTDSLTIHYYFDENPSEYMFFDDDGVSSQSIRQGQFELISMKAFYKNEQMQFNFVSNNGKYKNKPSKRNIRLVIHGKNFQKKKIYINEKEIESNISNKKLSRTMDYIAFDFSGGPVTITFK